MLPLPATDLGALRTRVRALAENRPGVYRMLDATGKVMYVGKAKRLRARLMSYFRASYPEDKGARILYAAHDIQWRYVPSEFASFLGELRDIRRYRPHFNYQLNHSRRPVLIAISGGQAPRMRACRTLQPHDEHAYGPFPSLTRASEAVRTLNDLLGLRDCAETMPMVFAGQGDLFGANRRAACVRHEFGFCAGPCAGFVTELDYRQRAETAMAFFEGRTLQPMGQVIAMMTEAAGSTDFERATRWREKFEQLEWLLAATSRARSAVDLLSFVYRDPGVMGDDQAFMIRGGLVRASYPWPATPIEEEAFRAAVTAELDQPLPPPFPLPLEGLDEILLLMRWFRTHPDALRRTSALESWVG